MSFKLARANGLRSMEIMRLRLTGGGCGFAHSDDRLVGLRKANGVFSISHRFHILSYDVFLSAMVSFADFSQKGTQ